MITKYEIVNFFINFFNPNIKKGKKLKRAQERGLGGPTCLGIKKKAQARGPSSLTCAFGLVFFFLKQDFLKDRITCCLFYFFTKKDSKQRVINILQHEKTRLQFFSLKPIFQSLLIQNI